MPAPVMRWYLSDDSALSGTLSFTPTAGSATSALTRNLWNDKGAAIGAEISRSTRLVAYARTAGTTPWLSDHSALVDGALEFRLTGQSGTGISAQTTPWTKLGPGRYGFLLDLPSNTKRVVEFRLNVSGSYTEPDVEFVVDVLFAQPAALLDDGYAPGGRRGVCHGVGDGRFSALLEGGVLTANGTPDNKVDATTVTWIHLGVPKCLAAHEMTFSNLDSASAALTSGQTYLATLSLGAGATVTVTKSVAALGPQATTNRPAVPDGEILLGYVEVEFDATIEQADIVQTDVLYGWFAYSASGLTVSINPGWALVDNVLIFTTRKNTVTLTNAATNYVWLSPTGTFTANTTLTLPVDRSLLLYEQTTAGSVITTSIDRRKFVGNQTIDVQVSIPGTLAANQDVYFALPSHGRCYLLPLYGVAMAVAEDGDTSGSTIVELETDTSAGAAAWTTMFTGAVGRPEVAHNSTTKRSDGARPIVFEPPIGGRARARVASIPGGTASADLWLLLRFVEV